jgi:hypothetical protein
MTLKNRYRENKRPFYYKFINPKYLTLKELHKSKIPNRCLILAFAEFTSRTGQKYFCTFINEPKKPRIILRTQGSDINELKAMRRIMWPNSFGKTFSEREFLKTEIILKKKSTQKEIVKTLMKIKNLVTGIAFPVCTYKNVPTYKLKKFMKNIRGYDWFKESYVNRMSEKTQITKTNHYQYYHKTIIPTYLILSKLDLHSADIIKLIDKGRKDYQVNLIKNGKRSEIEPIELAYYVNRDCFSIINGRHRLAACHALQVANIKVDLALDGDGDFFDPFSREERKLIYALDIPYIVTMGKFKFLF